jgi:hypothetical protein
VLDTIEFTGSTPLEKQLIMPPILTEGLDIYGVRFTFHAVESNDYLSEAD